MNCEESEELLAVNAVENPGGQVPDSVVSHLRSCSRCTESARRYAEIANSLPLGLPKAQPPSALRHRIMATVYAETVPERPPAIVRAFRRAWNALPQGRGWVVATTAAAMLFAGWGVSRSNRIIQPVTDVRTVAVVGTTEQPSARGHMTYDPATKTAVIDVENLQPLLATTGVTKTAYEVWLIRKNHSPIGAGFLTLQSDGRWTTAVQFSSGDYDEMAVTAEPAGGSPTPTGPPVVTSSL